MPVIDRDRYGNAFCGLMCVTFASIRQWLDFAQREQRLGRRLDGYRWRSQHLPADYPALSHGTDGGPIAIEVDPIEMKLYYGPSDPDESVRAQVLFEMIEREDGEDGPFWDHESSVDSRGGQPSATDAETFGPFGPFGPYGCVVFEHSDDWVRGCKVLQEEWPNIHVRDLLGNQPRRFPAVVSFDRDGTSEGYRIRYGFGPTEKAIAGILAPGERPRHILPADVECGGCGATSREYRLSLIEEDPCTCCGGYGSCCCDCSHCSSCNNLVSRSEMCINCYKCSDCCTCVCCDRCGDTVLSVCDVCGFGETCGCCRCRQIDLYGCSAPLNQAVHKPKGIKDRKELSLSRLGGVEIEVDAIGVNPIEWNRDQKPILDRWSARMIRDGSLSATGFEIATAPAGGDIFIRQLEEIIGCLNDAGGVINDNCAIHVHADGHDFGWYDIRKVALLYVACQPALFDLCHPKRRERSPNGQNYCRPWGAQLATSVLRWDKPKDTRKGLFGTIYKDVVLTNWGGRLTSRTMREAGRSVRRTKYGEHRYKAFNLHSYVYRGTLEFRHFHGSLDYEEIKGWAVTILSLVQAAQILGEREIRALYFSYLKNKSRSDQVLEEAVKAALRPDEADENISWMRQQRRRWS